LTAHKRPGPAVPPAVHVERKEFDPTHPPIGRKVRVAFPDGVILVGTTTGYQPGRPGLFLVPADAGSKVIRCYVGTAATRESGFPRKWHHLRMRFCPVRGATRAIVR
jgi:hypothetical protein